MDSPVIPNVDGSILLTGKTNAERLEQFIAFLTTHNYTVPYIRIDCTFYYPDKTSEALESATGFTVAFFASVLQHAFNTMEPGLLEDGALDLCDTLQKIAEHNRSLSN